MIILFPLRRYSTAWHQKYFRFFLKNILYRNRNKPSLYRQGKGLKNNGFVNAGRDFGLWLFPEIKLCDFLPGCQKRQSRKRSHIFGFPLGKALQGLGYTARGRRASSLPRVETPAGDNPERVGQNPAIPGVSAALTGLITKKIRLPGVAPAAQPRAVFRNPFGVPATFCRVVRRDNLVKGPFSFPKYTDGFFLPYLIFPASCELFFRSAFFAQPWNGICNLCTADTRANHGTRRGNSTKYMITS